MVLIQCHAGTCTCLCVAKTCVCIFSAQPINSGTHDSILAYTYMSSTNLFITKLCFCTHQLHERTCMYTYIVCVFATQCHKSFWSSQASTWIYMYIALPSLWKDLENGEGLVLSSRETLHVLNNIHTRGKARFLHHVRYM